MIFSALYHPGKIDAELIRKTAGAGVVALREAAVRKKLGDETTFDEII